MEANRVKLEAACVDEVVMLEPLSARGVPPSFTLLDCQ